MIDFPIAICGEKKVQNGEDSYYYHIGDRFALAAVCDGCGGAGAKKYPGFQGKTGAFLASRIVTGTLRDGVRDSLFVSGPNPLEDALKERINQNLGLAKAQGGTRTGLKGGLTKELPTTLAAVLTTGTGRDGIRIQCLWAGDSRCYCLSPKGLQQLTEDDLRIQDAMDNLTGDGVITNVISLSRDYQIHSRTIELEMPCMVFGATDGCFAYYTTPMEFEYSILHSLLGEGSARGFEHQLENGISEVAGDDFTMSGFAFGFGSWEKILEAYQHRFNELDEEYIRYLISADQRAPEETRTLWQKYKRGYSQYLNNGSEQEISI